MTKLSDEQLLAIAVLLKTAGFTCKSNPSPRLAGMIKGSIEFIYPSALADEQNYICETDDLTMLQISSLRSEILTIAPAADPLFTFVLMCSVDENNKWDGGFMLIGPACTALLPYFEPPA